MRRLSDERRPRLLTRCVALDVGNMLAKLSQLAGRIGPERGTAQHPAPVTIVDKIDFQEAARNILQRA